MPQLSPQRVDSLRQLVDASCADQQKGIPGVVAVVVDKDGKEQFAHASGYQGYGSSKPMNLDNIFWFASCTKMVTGIACMQLVENGSLALDDSEQVERLCPELKDVKVLQDDGKLVNKKRGITLRMLLCHTGELISRLFFYLPIACDWLYSLTTLSSGFRLFLLQRKDSRLQ